MKIETYLITWNRADSIHLTVNYYKKLGRVIVFDNFSTDGTREICEELGAEVRLFGKAGILDDQAYLNVKNECWKGSKADWVIIVDDDEIVYHSQLLDVLTAAKAARATIFKTQGFNIQSDDFPRETWLEILTGEPNENYSKLCIFDPKQILEIRYNYGCHAARPIGNLQFDVHRLILLHYRNVGGIERLIKRHQEYASRLSELNRRYNLGHHYQESEAEKRKQWKELSERCVHLSKAGLAY